MKYLTYMQSSVAPTELIDYGAHSFYKGNTPTELLSFYKELYPKIVIRNFWSNDNFGFNNLTAKQFNSQ